MKQRISECMDGELEPHSAAQVFDQVSTSVEYREHWMVYHMIGDGMRESPDLSPGFAERFAQRLEAEPTILAPRKVAAAAPARFAHYAMYAAASLSAVAVVGWVAFSSPLSPSDPQLARQDTPASVLARVAPQRPALSPLNSRDHDYLLAHQAVSPSGMMPGVAPYVRTVSFGTEANGR